MSETQDGTPTVDETSSTGAEPTSSPDVPTDVAPAQETTPEPASMAEYVSQQVQTQFEGEGMVPPEEDVLAAPEPEPEADPASAEADEASSPSQETAQPESEPDAEPESAEVDADTDAELPDEPTTEELDSYRPKVRKRIDKLLQQRYELRQEIEQAKPVMEVIQNHQLAGDDVQMALGLTAALNRGDFQGFLNGVAPLVQAAQSYLGQVLPPEYQQMVDQGYTTPEIAKQLVAAQSQANWNRVQMERQQEQQKAQQAQQQAEQVQMVIARSVTDWEAGIKAKDPDYARKESTIQRFAQALVAEHGAPKTQEDALRLAQMAYDEASKALAPPVPPPKATRETPSVGRTTRAAQPEPKSMADAVRIGLQRAHSA